MAQKLQEAFKLLAALVRSLIVRNTNCNSVELCGYFIIMPDSSYYLA